MRFPPAQGVLSPTQSGQPDGVPTLDANAVVPQDQLIPNTLSHAGALTALYNFNGSTSSTRGQRGQFSRASAANNPQTLASLPNDAPSYVWSKWGSEALALSVWEGTTNLVYNSDFETVTTTAQLFSDNITTSAAWTTQYGSFTFAALLANPTAAPTLSTATTGGSLAAATYYVVYTWENAYGQTMASPEASITTTGTTSTVTVTVPTLPDGATLTGIYMSTSTGTETLQGTTATTSYTQSAALVAGAALPTSNTAQLGATSGANGSIITAGNIAWKPLLGSDGSTSLPLTVQTTVVSPSNSVVDSGHLIIWVNSGNYYDCYISQSASTVNLRKAESGNIYVLSSVTQTISASTTYTITLSLDHLGNLTAKLYSGAGTGGTLLQTLTATDTSLSGGFLLGVGGDTGVVVSNASMTGAWANNWNIGGDLRVAWALTTSAINEKYSANAIGISGVSGYIFPYTNIPATSSDPYTISGYINTNSVGASGAYLQYDTLNSTPTIISGGSTFTTKVTGTTVTTRYNSMETIGSTAVSIRPYCVLADSGTATFDAIQVEQKSYSTPYLKNNSTTATATRNAETMTVPAHGMSESAGTILGWFTFGSSIVNTSGTTTTFRAFDDDSDSYSIFMDAQSLHFRAGGSSDSTVTAPSSIMQNTPVHLALTWNGTDFYGYVNGSQVTSAAQGTNTVANPIYIGSGAGFGQQIDGSASNVAFFDNTLTAQEIYSIYASTQPLVDALATPISTDVVQYNTTKSNMDANGVYQTVTKSRFDGTTYVVATSSNPVSGTSLYQTVTMNYYDTDGITLMETVTWTITYDSNNNIASTTKQ